MNELYTSLIELGALGSMLVVMIAHQYHLTKIHRQEREQWRQDSNRLTEKFSGVIEKNTEAMTKLNENILRKDYD